MPRTPVMSVAIANALLTNAPLSDEQLKLAYQHYAHIAELLSYSGPRFADARMEAISWANKARTQLIKQRREAAEKQKDNYDDDLEEIR